MFEGFAAEHVKLPDAELFARIGGSGPPLLLLHGYPQTHAIWHRAAPLLAERFTLVIPDLPGYGDSIAPVPEPDGARYAKRAMGRDMLALMTHLGHERFRVAGHDRGGRVAYRLALDAPEQVERLAVIDIITTLDMYERLNNETAWSAYHWLFLAQPAPMPERLIGNDPDFYLEHLLARWAGRRDALAPEAVEAYRAAFRKPSVIGASCADYRAAFTFDRQHDRDDREAGRRIRCPVLCLWARGYMSKRTSSPATLWRAWADQVEDVAIDCGHFILEESPDAASRALLDFFCQEHTSSHVGTSH